MLYYDYSRLTANNFYELISFCEKKAIPSTLLQVESGICYAHVAQFKKIIEKSSGVKIVDADEFMRFGLEMESEYALKEANKAYHESKQRKMIQDSTLVKEGLKTSKKGKNWVKVGSYKKEATGELEVFNQIWDEAVAKSPDGKVRSEISGELLIQNKNHHLWINQFAHVAGKSVAENYRLRKDNVTLMLPAEHYEQTVNEGKCRLNPKWDKFFAQQEKLRIEYEKQLRESHGRN